MLHKSGKHFAQLMLSRVTLWLRVKYNAFVQHFYVKTALEHTVA